MIVKMTGLDKLVALEQLYLNDNRISRMEGLTINKNLHMINMNNQKSKRPL